MQQDIVSSIRHKLTIALAGNPNSGKTTIFNNLTGSHQHVGNYPGVTVERKEGVLDYKGYKMTIVDLPGTYSLSAYSMDEQVVRDFVIDEKPDVVIDVIDASNLERNLYLATQLMELGVRLVLCFNMSDVAARRGLRIDTRRLSELLGSPIVTTIATKNKGINELLDMAINLAQDKIKFDKTNVNYGREVHEEVKKIESICLKDDDLAKRYPLRWLRIKLLEADDQVTESIKKSPYAQEIITQVQRSRKHLEGIFNDTTEAVIADRRYGFISGACSEAVRRSYEVRHTISDRIDKVLVNRILGLPIFLGLIWIVFKLTFQLSGPLMTGIATVQDSLGSFFGGVLPQGSAIQSFVVGGIINGVGSVFVFVPVIFLLFLAIAILEDSGYMARAAFIMDRIMHKIGLHGRSFIPMLLGFGCTVPAIMATRIIKDRKDRMVTILVSPFMSCGARLVVYTLFVGAFFSKQDSGTVLFSLYILGIIAAIVMAKLFRKYLFKGEDSAFVMELPPYRIPTIKGLLIHMWERGRLYLKKAGTIIFVGTICMWFLSSFPYHPRYSRDYSTLIKQAKGNEKLVARLGNEKAYEKMDKSYLGQIGHTIAPVFKPLGFNNWKISVGLMAGFVAKEIVIGTLGTLHPVGPLEDNFSLRKVLQEDRRADGTKLFNPLTAYALLVFILLYVPCLATIAVIKRETNSWRWPIFTIFYTTLVAWIAAFVVYQGGRLIGLG